MEEWQEALYGFGIAGAVMGAFVLLTLSERGERIVLGLVYVMIALICVVVPLAALGVWVGSL